MPPGDSVRNVISWLDVSQIKCLKQKMVQILLQRMTLHSSRYRGHWFRVAVDTSGAGSYDHKRDE